MFDYAGNGFFEKERESTSWLEIVSHVEQKSTDAERHQTVLKKIR